MNQELTFNQENNLKTWAEQRDSLLSEVSVLRTEVEKLQNISKDLSVSHTATVTEMNEIKGRIEELKIKENELLLITSKEVASLQSEKSRLEAVVPALEKLIEVLTSQKTSLEADVSFALSAFEAVKGETLLLDKVVDRVTQVSASNAARIDSLVDYLAMGLEEIIEVNRKNVFETNVVIEKLPAMLMEAQKHGLIKNKI
jgi:predicted  nucleic acid-binding Zn-ribbon protein